MFYDSERMLRKQLKYVKLKAYETIFALEAKGLEADEVLASIEMLLKSDNSEFQIDILELAKDILLARKEASNEVKDTGSSYTNTSSLINTY
jgi:hypothetical protein